MNNIINQLSQIEEKTVAILDGAADKKKTLAAEYEAKTKQFDEELNSFFQGNHTVTGHGGGFFSIR